MAAAAEAEAQKARSGDCGEYTKLAVTILKNTISGVITIYLYFADLQSDFAVTKLYYDTGALRFAFVSACLLIGQFAVVWSRVLPYLYSTYGPTSLFYRLFLYFGMPIGCLLFDCVMFLQVRPHSHPTRVHTHTPTHPHILPTLAIIFTPLSSLPFSPPPRPPAIRSAPHHPDARELPPLHSGLCSDAHDRGGGRGGPTSVDHAGAQSPPASHRISPHLTPISPHLTASPHSSPPLPASRRISPHLTASHRISPHLTAPPHISHPSMPFSRLLLNGPTRRS